MVNDDLVIIIKEKEVKNIDKRIIERIIPDELMNELKSDRKMSIIHSMHPINTWIVFHDTDRWLQYIDKDQRWGGIFDKTRMILNYDSGDSLRYDN